jgi:hypothetical protein
MDAAQPQGGVGSNRSAVPAPPQPSPVDTGEGEPRSGWEGAGTNLKPERSPYRIVGMMYSAPARMPVGQRAVTVLSLV